MDFIMDKQHLLLRQLYREFAENEVEPIAGDIDETGEPPMEKSSKERHTKKEPSKRSIPFSDGLAIR